MSNKYHFVHERGDYPPLAIENIASAWTGSIKRTVGYNESPAYFIFQDGWCRIYSYEKVHQKIINFTFKKISQDKQYTRKIRKIFDCKVKTAELFINSLKRINWKKINNNALFTVKERYTKLYYTTAPFGEPLPYFLKEKLQQILETELLAKLKVTSTDFETLLTPLYQSFLSRESQQLRQIAQKYKNKPLKLKEKIKKHQQKYSWLLFDYASIVADNGYFYKRAKGRPPKLINYRKLKNHKRQIIKKYQITSRCRYYINLLEDLFYLMDKKKEILTRLHFAITPLYQEAGKRLGFSLPDVRWFLWDEVKKALTNGRILKKDAVKNRRKLSGIKYQQGKPSFLKSKEIAKLLKSIAAEERSAVKAQLVKGVSASPGKIIGRVRYLKSAKENHKVKKGEILLVSNTTPDFMPAIQKAVAIVTNEGGLTCHAAIVSREFDKPCIIGAKMATKALKTGDFVIMDTEKGIVKKINNR